MRWKSNQGLEIYGLTHNSCRLILNPVDLFFNPVDLFLIL